MVKFRESDIVKKYNHKDKSKILDYIETMYSKDSKIKRTDSLEDQKKDACSIVGWDFEKNEDLVNLKDDSFNHLVFTYMSMTQPNKFVLLMSSLQLFWNQQKRMMMAYDGTDEDPDKELKYINLQNTIAEKSHDLLDRVDGLLAEIYKEDESVELAKKQLRPMVKLEERVKKINSAKSSA